jgi:hypothetical protein
MGSVKVERIGHLWIVAGVKESNPSFCLLERLGRGKLYMSTVNGMLLALITDLEARATNIIWELSLTKG